MYVYVYPEADLRNRLNVTAILNIIAVPFVCYILLRFKA
jgi:hypothetical protein